jgi:hypothetical protein
MIPLLAIHTTGDARFGAIPVSSEQLYCQSPARHERMGRAAREIREAGSILVQRAEIREEIGF